MVAQLTDENHGMELLQVFLLCFSYFPCCIHIRIAAIIQNLCRCKTSQVYRKYNTSPISTVRMSSPSAYLFVLRNVFSSIFHVGFAIGFWIILGFELIAGALALGLFVSLLALPIIYYVGGFANQNARASKEASANDNTDRDLEANIETSEVAILAPSSVTTDEGPDNELPVQFYELNITTPTDLAAPVEENVPADSEDSTDSTESETYYKSDDSDLEELDPLFEEPLKNEK